MIVIRLHCRKRLRVFFVANYLAVKSAGAGAGACVSDCGSGQHADIDGNCADNALCVGYCPKSTSPLTSLLAF